MDCDEPHLSLNEKKKPIQWIEWPTNASVVAGSLWPIQPHLHQFHFEQFLKTVTFFLGLFFPQTHLQTYQPPSLPCNPSFKFYGPTHGSSNNLKGPTIASALTTQDGMSSHQLHCHLSSPLVKSSITLFPSPAPTQIGKTLTHLCLSSLDFSSLP
jgi:hypothetical protein